MAVSDDIQKIFKNAAEKKRVLQGHVQTLMEEIAAKQAEMRGVLVEIERIDLTIKGIRELGGFDSESVEMPKPQWNRVREETGLNKAGFGNKRAFFEQVVREAILKAGRPMGTTELLTAFRDIGHEVGGADPWKQVSNLLWAAKRDGRLIHRIGLGYWPSDVPNVALSYAPPPGGAPPPLPLKRLQSKAKRPKLPAAGMGQPNVLTPEQAERARELRAKGLSYRAIAATLGAGSQSTIMRYLRDDTRATRREEAKEQHTSQREARDLLFRHPGFVRMTTGEDRVVIQVNIPIPPITEQQSEWMEEMERLARQYQPQVKAVDFEKAQLF